MPAALSIITITDGTTTVTLTDTTKYGLLEGGWSPQVPVRRSSTLGGRPYTTVSEELRFDVYGATMAAAFTNLAAIVALIDQAAAWHAGESVDPVTVTYLPQGSDLASALTSLVLGFADGPPLTLPASFNDRLMLYEISDVSLRFLRDGVWYGAEEENNTLITSEPTVTTITMVTDSPMLAPVVVRVGPFLDAASITDYDTSFLLVANAASRLQVLDAATMSSGGVWSTDPDAAREPQGTGVLIYTPVATTEVQSGIGSITLVSGRRVGVVVALRNTGSATFTVQVEIQGKSGRNPASTRPYFVDDSTVDPRLISLGVALCDDDFYGGVRLRVSASAVAGTLVFDYIALVNLDGPTSRILEIGPIDATQTIPVGEQSYLRVDPRALTARTPRVRQTGAAVATNYATPEYWRGDAFLLSEGTTVAAIYCGRPVGSHWTMVDPGTGSPFALSILAIRRSAYLAPT